MTAAILVIAAAVIVGLRRHRRTLQGPPNRDRRRRLRAVIVVGALVAGSALIGSPAMAQPFDCKDAPEPDRPGTGLVGSFDVPTRGLGELGSVYYEVGYAGLVWHNYDVGCGPSAALNPGITTDTWMGNQTFNVAKFTVGGVNWSHYLIAEGGGLLTPLDEMISQGTSAMYRGVFTTWVGLALAILTIMLFVLAMRGDLAKQAQRTAFAVIALAIGAAAYLAPMDWAKAADPLLLDGVTKMQEGFLGQAGLGGRDTLPTVLVDQVIYNNWLRGEFGSADVPQAQQFGRDLLRAQTFTKAELAAGATGPTETEAKKAAFKQLAERMGDRYAYFQGKSGNRTGVGVLAVLQAMCIALFQLLSKVLVLVAMLLLRLMVMCAPAIAVLAILKPDILPRVLKVAGGAIVNTLIVGALAGLHSLLVVSLFRPGSGVDLWLALLVTGVVTVVLWAVARPFRRLVSMVSLTREQFGGVVPGAGTGPMSRMWRRIRGSDEAAERQERWWNERRTAAVAGAGGRPESSRAESATAARAGDWFAGGRRRQTEVTAADSAAIQLPSRRALPAGVEGAGVTTGGWPSWSDPGAMDDRVIYRRPDSVIARAGAVRPVEPELVDGRPVYRIYRPRNRQPVVDWTGPRRAD